MSHHNLTRLRQLNRRLHALNRDATGRYQTTAEIEREEREQRRSGITGAAGGAVLAGGAYAAARSVASSKIGSIGPDGIRKVGDLLKRLPLRGGRILSGGALGAALKNLR